MTLKPKTRESAPFYCSCPPRTKERAFSRVLRQLR
ncbi:hypothetical protein EVA_18248 [gut metagenome]|uniref:Uncharacterized protein n=1 Tax=gut metagenome TaxID=749906 RepID=J9FFG6_9ZZZZ